MSKRSILVLILVAMFDNFALAQLEAQAAKFRDASKEDEVARVFENARKQAGAKPLTRVKFRHEVQEIVCTAALNDRVPTYSTGVPALGGDAKRHPASALYKTTDPAKVTGEMETLASLDPLHKQGYKRFSVAVWRSALSGAEGQYWVGVRLYWSQGIEFFDYHFTDDILYHNSWKKTVSPECRGR